MEKGETAMRHYTCDICGCELPRGRLRYVAKVDVYAAYDTLEITREELERDLDEELRALFERMKDVDPEELLRDVYANFKFDLCPRCHREYLRDPLAGFGGARQRLE
jgi:hypothetical protein